ncbi:MAG TPA: helix-turn-helix domain-containing protein [Gammaproteobacteria bacterium]|nr:helix-turn-helix domain-containing protein [Gammaproteobacteria bacterium]
MQALALLLIGYSVFTAPVIALTHFRGADYAEYPASQAFGVVLLALLTALQGAHFAYLQYSAAFVHGPFYRMLLFAVAPVFYLFAAPLLEAQAGFRPRQALHLLPIVAVPWLPYGAALPLAFAVGAVYLLWLARTIYALRAQRIRFRLELTLLAMVFGIAVLAAALGLGLPLLGDPLFYALYASAIGCALLLVTLVLGLAPRLSEEVAAAARETYAVSTLIHVDCAAALTKLEAFMQQDRLFEQPTLKLSTLARRVGLSSHQLSELINTRLGKSFSLYLREYRVEAARELLLAQPAASVLSVGLSVGFTSQSNFYDAFRQITGMTPGQFRKLHASAAAE